MDRLKQFRKMEFQMREKNLLTIRKQVLTPNENPPKRLHVVYVLTHVGVCGGTKIILEHANHLTAYGHKVTLVSHFPQPVWFPVSNMVSYAQVPFSKELAQGIPPCDVVVVTYWREISECVAKNIAPVVYFEQGDYHLFDWEHVGRREKDYIYGQFQLAPFLYTVSQGAAAQIKKLFGRDATVINNAIDHTIFYPPSVKSQKNSISVAAMGSETAGFKRLKDIKAAVSLLQKGGAKAQLRWISPDPTKKNTENVFVNPSQIQIANLLRTADFFVCASLYESFSLPVLEAMACGCAVVTTANTGVLEYAEDGVNCLMAEMKNPEDISKKITDLLANPDLHARLSEEGIKTSRRFSWGQIIPQLIGYYRQIASFVPREKSVF